MRVTRYKVELGNLETLGFTRNQLILQYSLIGIIADVLGLLLCLLFWGFSVLLIITILKVTGVWFVIL